MNSAHICIPADYRGAVKQNELPQAAVARMANVAHAVARDQRQIQREIEQCPSNRGREMPARLPFVYAKLPARHQRDHWLLRT
jgi:hypothetical protein